MRRNLSAATLSAMFAAGSADPVGVTESALDQISSCDDQAIFTVVTAERALREAVAARQRIREGRPLSALDGIPVAWKDLFDIAGLATSAGSRVAGAAPAQADAAAVRRLEQAGVVAIGRVNMSEFAFSGIGLNPHFGTPHNPHGAGGPYIPGGSSSGSGVAVARGLVPVSIGTDTGGSVRIPAALNGVVGYKATAGRYPTTGIFPLSRTLDSLGVISTTVEDAALVDAAMRGSAPSQTGRSMSSRICLLIPSEVVFDGCAPAVIKNFERAIERLAATGVEIRPVAIPAFEAILALNTKHGAIINAEAYALHRDRIDGDAATRMDRRVVARIRAGERTTQADYAALLYARQRLITETNTLFANGAIIAYPTTAITAPRIADLEADDEAFFAANALMLRNTMFGNFLDWCGVTLPTGRDTSGLPTAMLLSGAPGADPELLGVAASCERIIIG